MQAQLPNTRAMEFARRNSPIIASYVIVLVLFLIGTIYTSNFASIDHIKVLLIFASFVGIAALGQTLCILTGGIDLSVPWVMTGSAVLTSIVAGGQASKLPQALLLVLGLAICVGLLNGIGVAYIGIPPIIMTLGMNGALQGLLLVYTNGGFSSTPPQDLVNFVVGNTLGIPNDILIWLAVIIFGAALLTWTTFGRRLYAIGTNSTAAHLAGIPVRRVLVVPYVVSAISASIAGLLLMGYTGQAFLSMGDPYLFTSAVAVAVGGASILGGKGHYLGTVAGALILTLVAAILPLYGLITADVQISYGLILLATVFVASLRLTRR
jgi:ribose transport system permease protein